MSQPCYRFNQLFERLPNGRYRERDKPAPPLGVDHRHDFFRSPHTGRICVLYPAMSLSEAVLHGWASIKTPVRDRVCPGSRLTDTAYGTFDPKEGLSFGLRGGRWGEVDYREFWNIDPCHRSDMMDAFERHRFKTQPATQDGTDGGIL